MSIAELKLLLPFIAILLVAAVAVIAFCIIRARKKADQRIRDAFGKMPEYDRENRELSNAYHQQFANAHPNSRRIDHTTWNDLNMDDVFWRINACSCSVGEEYLYHILHELKGTPAELEKRERLLAWVNDHPEERLRLQKLLLGIGKKKHNGLSYYLLHASTKILKNSWIFVIMALLPVLGIALIPFFSTAGIALAFGAICANLIVYYVKRLSLENELESMRYFSAFLYGAKSINKRAGGKLEELGFDLAGSLKPFQKMRGLLPGKTQKAMADLETLILFGKSVFLVDLILYNHTVRMMAKHSKKLNALFEIIGEIDTAICVASYRCSLQHYCVPVFHSENTIRFSEIYHPLLKESVTNSASISNDSIITGSNASGKSTFIKTIAINSILAQTIHTCCAKQYALGFCYVATSMALRDDILSGDSYFITEIKSLQRIFEYCKAQRCVCFIDEILRGTNTPERIASSSAVLKSLHQTESLCIVASHDIELTEILSGIYDNYHFSETFESNAITFDYLLKEGASHSTNAIRLLEYMGFDKKIVEEATAFIQSRQK